MYFNRLHREMVHFISGIVEAPIKPNFHDTRSINRMVDDTLRNHSADWINWFIAGSFTWMFLFFIAYLPRSRSEIVCKEGKWAPILQHC